MEEPSESAAPRRWLGLNAACFSVESLFRETLFPEMIGTGPKPGGTNVANRGRDE